MKDLKDFDVDFEHVKPKKRINWVMIWVLTEGVLLILTLVGVNRRYELLLIPIAFIIICYLLMLNREK